MWQLGVVSDQSHLHGKPQGYTKSCLQGPDWKKSNIACAGRDFVSSFIASSAGAMTAGGMYTLAN